MNDSRVCKQLKTLREATSETSLFEKWKAFVRSKPDTVGPNIPWNSSCWNPIKDCQTKPCTLQELDMGMMSQILNPAVIIYYSLPLKKQQLQNSQNMAKVQRSAVSLLWLQMVIVVKPKINSLVVLTSSSSHCDFLFCSPSLILEPIPAGQRLAWASFLIFPCVTCLISGSFSNQCFWSCNILSRNFLIAVFSAVCFEIV